MADIYSPTQEYFKDTPYLEYGGYQVKPTEWYMENNPAYAGQGATLYYSKTDPNQAFKVDRGSAQDLELQQYLAGYGGVNQLQSDTAYTGTAPQFTLQQIAEKERQAGLIQQMQSGQLTEAQATESANNPPASAPLKSEQIASGEIPYGTWQPSENRAEKKREKSNNEPQQPIDYTLRPGESTEAYHQRIAQARGEAPIPGVADGTQPTGAQSQANIDYTLHPGESIAQYNARIATARGEIPGSVGTGGTNTYTDSGFADSQSGKGLTTGGQGQQPSSFISLYKDVIKSLGLTDIKAEFKKTVEEQAKLQNELNDEISEINDNPWLSEGVRVKQIERMKEKYETKLAILTNKQQIYDSLYKEGVQQAQYLATGEYNAQADAAALAEKRYEAELKLLEIDPSNFKEVQGGLYDIKEQKWIVAPQPKTVASTGAGTIASSGSLIGADGKPVKLSSGQQDDVSTMDTVVSLAKQVLAVGEDLPGVGGLATGSISQFLAKNFGYGSTQGQDIRNMIGNIQGTIAKLRGGTSFTPTEQKLLETYSPTINDSDKVIISKLNGLISYINTKKQNLLNVAGGNYTGETSADPLGIF